MSKKIGQDGSLFDATQKILAAVCVGSFLVAVFLASISEDVPSNTVMAAAGVSFGLTMLCLPILFFRQRAHRRGQSNKLADLAQQVGWRFSNEDEDLLSNLWGFELSREEAHRRVGREIADVLDPGPGRLASGQEYQVRIFRFWQDKPGYSSGTGKLQKIGRLPEQTVIWFRSPQLSLPSFVMRPEHVFHKIGSAFGYQDIDFESNRTAADFSKKYLLRGEDEHAIRSLFKDNVLSFFATHSGKPVLEGRGDRLILYRPGQLIRPENISV
ncbi:MAG: hypothetical protein CME27_07925, partial [Gemmatimonadetes bacterium]|nr:hypothetical protein [Gemmatimonadota bacterium]